MSEETKNFLEDVISDILTHTCDLSLEEKEAFLSRLAKWSSGQQECLAIRLEYACQL